MSIRDIRHSSALNSVVKMYFYICILYIYMYVCMYQLIIRLEMALGMNQDSYGNDLMQLDVAADDNCSSSDWLEILDGLHASTSVTSVSSSGKKKALNSKKRYLL